MNIPMCSKSRQIRRWKVTLTAIVMLSTFQAALAQERVYPPEPQHAGVHLTPLSQLTQLEKDSTDLMLAVDAKTGTSVKPAAKPALSAQKPAAKTVATAKKKPVQKRKAIQKAVAKPIPAPVTPVGLDTTKLPEQPAVQPDIEAMSLKPQTEVPPVKGSSFGNLTTFLQKTKPTSYSPVEAIAIFPVIKHGQESTFADMPILFAREFALKLESVVPKTRIYNPVYTVDELRVRGLGHVYDQIMGYYLKAGRPEPKATDYLLKQLSATDGKTISRIIFVEADLDMNRFTEQSGLFDRLNGWLTDATPKQMKSFVNSRLQVFDAENPNLPMVWGGSWRRSIKNNQFVNVTPSVFSDSDSQQSLAGLSREMSREILWLAPKEAYMAPQYDLSVQGKLASKKDTPFPNFTESLPGKTPINETHKQAIQRILQRQNAVSP